MKAYIDHWETYTTNSRAKNAKAMEKTQTSRWRNWAKAAHLLYPQECFVPTTAILEQAAKLVANDSEAKARVLFLQLGLQHAQLCARV